MYFSVYKYLADKDLPRESKEQSRWAFLSHGHPVVDGMVLNLFYSNEDWETKQPEAWDEKRIRDMEYDVLSSPEAKEPSEAEEDSEVRYFSYYALVKSTKLSRPFIGEFDSWDKEQHGRRVDTNGNILDENGNVTGYRCNPRWAVSEKPPKLDALTATEIEKAFCDYK
jgi:hypothetical protein